MDYLEQGLVKVIIITEIEIIMNNTLCSLTLIQYITKTEKH